MLLIRDGLLLVGKGSGNIFRFCGLDLGWNSLGGAVDDVTVLYETLHHPVAVSGTVDARVDASRTEVVVSIVADAAVEVLVVHRVVAVVAVHNPGSTCCRWLGSERERGIVWSLGQLVEEGCR